MCLQIQKQTETNRNKKRYAGRSFLFHQEQYKVSSYGFLVSGKHWYHLYNDDSYVGMATQADLDAMGLNDNTNNKQQKK
jgi:hypothetical protein